MAAAHASIVNQDIDLAECRDCFADYTCPVSITCDIERAKPCLASRVADPGHDVSPLSIEDIRHHDTSAFGRKQFCC